MSVTHPESGTVSYTYNADGSTLQKTDAKGQRVKWEYTAAGQLEVSNTWNQNPQSSDIEFLLHDLGHAMNLLQSDQNGMIQKDSGVPLAQDHNSSYILKNCLTEVEF